MSRSGSLCLVTAGISEGSPVHLASLNLSQPVLVRVQVGCVPSHCRFDTLAVTAFRPVKTPLQATMTAAEDKNGGGRHCLAVDPHWGRRRERLFRRRPASESTRRAHLQAKFRLPRPRRAPCRAPRRDRAGLFRPCCTRESRRTGAPAQCDSATPRRHQRDGIAPRSACAA